MAVNVGQGVHILCRNRLEFSVCLGLNCIHVNPISSNGSHKYTQDTKFSGYHNLLIW